MLDLILAPIIGALLGYSTNWLAIRMLFRPLTEKRLFGVKLPFTPGLIPKERYNISKKVSRTVVANVLTTEELVAAVRAIDIESATDEMLSGLAKSEMTVRDAVVRLGFASDNFDWSAFDRTVIEYVMERVDKEKLTDWLGSLSEEREKLAGAVNSFVEKNIGGAGELLASALDKSPNLEAGLRELVRKIADDNFGFLVGIFINYNKIYDNIKENILSFLSDPDKQRMLSEKITERVSEYATSDEIFSGLNDASIESVGRVLNDKLPVFRERLLDAKISGVGRIFAFFPGAKRATAEIACVAIESIGAYLIEKLDFEAMIEDKINSFDVKQSEELILSVAKRELSVITFLGAPIGFIIGLLPAIYRIFG